MRGKHFYPDIIASVLVWGRLFVAYVRSHAAAWGIPAAEITHLDDAWTRYADAQNLIDKPEMRTSINIAEAKRLRSLAIKAIQRVKNGYIDAGLKLGTVSEMEYEAVGLQLPKSKHTRRGDPTDHVEFEFGLDPQSHRVSVKFRVEGSVNYGKGNYHAVEIRYWVRALAALPPPNAEEAGWLSETDTASPWYKDFSAKDIGQRLWMSLRWTNYSIRKGSKTGKGPWSEIKSVIIP
jgi:hypothetical protein